MTMVDALLSAAHSEDSEYFEEEVPQISSPPLRSSAPQIRVCEFCNSSNTPTWRRGPGGKGSLCNACGIKWRLRKRTKKGDTSDKPKASKSPAKRQKRTNIIKDLDYQPDYHMATLRNPIVFRENITTPEEPSSPTSLDNRKNYFCKFCNKTWDFNHFKNSQQFGAHCSNCSRRSSQQDGMVPDGFSSSPLSSPLSSPTKSPPSFVFSPPTPTKRFPPPPYDDAHSNLMLILRLMQEEDDFSDYESEPQTPTTPPSPTSVVPISSINPINVL